MAGFDALIRSAVATAKALVGDVQATVVHRAATGHNGHGVPTFGSPVSRLAIVESKIREIRQADGETTLTKTKLTFLDNVAITKDDELTLPDGTKGPILDIGSLQGSGGAYLVEVWLG
jgi:hypothetical protein